MNNLSIKKCASMVFSLLLGGSILFYSVDSNALELIINSEASIKSISQSDLRAVFSGRMRQWPSGVPVRVVLLKGDPDLHVDFCKNYVKYSPLQLRRVWKRVIFSGMGEGPYFVSSTEEMEKAVKEIPGAIGYVGISTQKEGINELSVE